MARALAPARRGTGAAFVASAPVAVVGPVRRLRRGRGRNPEQRGLHQAKALVVAANPDRGVVVEERVAQANERVGERRRVDRRLVAPGGHLLLDQRLHARHRARLDHAGARGQHPHRAVALLLEQPPHRPRARERAVDAVEHLEHPGRAAPSDLGPLARDEQLELRAR